MGLLHLCTSADSDYIAFKCEFIEMRARSNMFEEAVTSSYNPELGSSFIVNKMLCSLCCKNQKKLVCATDSILYLCSSRIRNDETIFPHTGYTDQLSKYNRHHPKSSTHPTQSSLPLGFWTVPYI